MKMSLACLALVAGLFPSLAKANDATIEVEADTEIRFLKNYKNKIEALEDYSVTFSDGTVIRHGRRPASAGADGVSVKMIKKAKRS